MYYLGKYGSEASKREYARIIAEFVANGRQQFYRPDEILIESLIVRYLSYVEKELDYSEGILLVLPSASLVTLKFTGTL